MSTIAFLDGNHPSKINQKEPSVVTHWFKPSSSRKTTGVVLFALPDAMLVSFGAHHTNNEVLEEEIP